MLQGFGRPIFMFDYSESYAEVPQRQGDRVDWVIVHTLKAIFSPTVSLRGALSFGLVRSSFALALIFC